MLAHHVDVLEVALDRARLVGRGGARHVVDHVHDRDRGADAVGGGQAQHRALFQGDRAGGEHRVPDLAHRFPKKGAAGPQPGLGPAHLALDHRLIAQQRVHGPRGLGGGQLHERGQAAPRGAEGHRGVPRGEDQGPREAVERAPLHQRRGHRLHGAVLRHEDVVDREVMRTGAAHAPDLPGVEELGFRPRHEAVAHLGLAVVEPRPALLGDGGMRGQPRGVPAPGAEALAAGDPVAARHHDGLRVGLRCIGHHRARGIDPDGARRRGLHPRRVGREDRHLVGHPRGAGVGSPELLDHLDIARQVHLRTAERARQREPEEARVGHRLEERTRQLALRVRLRGGRPDQRRERPRRLEGREAHWIGECGVATRRVTLICSRSIMVPTRAEISFFQ